MPGQSKVNGTWRTVSGLSVKVGGQWKTATSAFVKVGGVWKQWFASKVQDAFNRASTASGLGTADSGQVWTALRGNWRVSGANSAISDDAGSTYALASANLGNTDVSVQADVSGGTGVAFWVTDSGSWWASYPQYTQSTSAITGSCTTPASYSYYYSTWNTTVSGTSCSGTYSFGTTNPTSSQISAAGCCSGVSSQAGSLTCGSYQYSVTFDSCASGCSYQFVEFRSVPSTSSYCNYAGTINWTGSAPSNCCFSYNITTTPTTTYTIPACGTQCSGTVGGGTTYTIPECGTQCSGVAGGGTTYSYFAIERAGDSCANYGATSTSCSNSSNCICNNAFYCCRTTTTSGSVSCTGNCQVETSYSCSGNCQSGSVTTGQCMTNLITSVTYTNVAYYNCYTTSSQGATTYSCNTPQGTSSCSGSASCTGYNCYSGGACGGLSQNLIGTGSSCSGGQSTCSGAGCTPSNCCSGVSYSGGDTTYYTDLVIVSSVSGTVVSQSATRLATNTNTTYTTVGSLIVSTVGNQITAKAYASAGLTTQLGSNIVITPTSPTKGTSVGIIKAPSTGSQGSTVDNFLGTI